MWRFVKNHPYVSVLLILPVAADVAATAVNKGINLLRSSANAKTASTTSAPTSELAPTTTTGG
jgi:hypothetical protein